MDPDEKTQNNDKNLTIDYISKKEQYFLIFTNILSVIIVLIDLSYIMGLIQFDLQILAIFNLIILPHLF